MKLTKIQIQNFRSIKDADIDLTPMSIFVGQNNHGKTNIFEAIHWFYTARSSDKDEHYDCNEANEISVTFHFVDVVDSDIDKLAAEANRTRIRTMLDSQTVFSVTKTSSDHKRTYVVTGVDRGNPSGLDTAINEFLPRLEYVSTNIRLDDVAKFKDKNPIGTMLSGVLATIIEASDDYVAFREQFTKLFESDESEVRQELDKLGAKVELYLQKQFPDGTKVTFSVNPPHFTELLKSFETSVHDGIETSAQAKGDGMQRALMLSIIQAFADFRKQRDGGGNFLFLLDEAELHLHPSAQRALKRALLDICDVDQVLLNTHSSVLVVDEHANQTLFRVEKDSKVTHITPVDALGRQDVIFELLGGSPSDLLLPRNFLIVEGKCEFEFLQTVIRRFYSTQYSGLKILFSGGDMDRQQGSLLGVHQLFSPLAGSGNPIYRDRAIVLIDKPNSTQQHKYDIFKNGYPYLFTNNQVFELPHNCLEEYYPAPHTLTMAQAKDLEVARKKVAYAKSVAEAITQAEFENDMPVLLATLERCREQAFAV